MRARHESPSPFEVYERAWVQALIRATVGSLNPVALMETIKETLPMDHEGPEGESLGWQILENACLRQEHPNPGDLKWLTKSSVEDWEECMAEQQEMSTRSHGHSS